MTPTLDTDLRALDDAASRVGYYDALQDRPRETFWADKRDAAEARIRAIFHTLEQENARLRDVAYLADIYLEHDGTRKSFNAAWLYDTRRKLESALAAIDLVAIRATHEDYGQQPASISRLRGETP